VLSTEQLLDLARARVRRAMTDEECRFYLHLEACPRTAVPDVVGSTVDGARSTLEAAGFRVRLAFTMPTSDPAMDGTVMVQDPTRNVELVVGSRVALVLARYSAP
jgi:beta-lactam-binding protein with PASTA domain